MYLRMCSGGSRGGGSGPPFGPRCRLFNIGPKVGPPPFCECPRVGVFFNFSEGGWRHADADNVQGGGGACECPRGGGVLVKNPGSAPGPPPPFQKSWIRAWCVDTYIFATYTIRQQSDKGKTDIMSFVNRQICRLFRQLACEKFAFHHAVRYCGRKYHFVQNIWESILLEIEDEQNDSLAIMEAHTSF